MMSGIPLIPDVDASPEVQRLFMSRVGAVRERVEFFRAVMRNLLQGRLGPGRYRFDVPQWDIVGQAIANRLSGIEVHIESMSDAMVLAVPLEETAARDPIGSVCAMCDVLQMAMLLFLANETPIRGGVEVATGFSLSDGGVYGPALTFAYGLESEVADYPRIVCGQWFINYLKHKEQRLAELSDARERAWIADALENIRRCIVTDDDGLAVINVVGRPIVDIAIYEELKNAARKFVWSEVQKHGVNNDVKLLSRYARLLRFMSRHDESE